MNLNENELDILSETHIQLENQPEDSVFAEVESPLDVTECEPECETPVLTECEALECEPLSCEASEVGETKIKKNHSQYDLFLNEYEKTEGVEAKLQMTIDFMELSLAQAGNPHFKSFWDARSICLHLFKENISQVLRAQMWAKYTELSKEARRLKEILDEQSSFAAEQIEIAIKALETDLTLVEQILEKSKPIDFGFKAESFNDRYSYYDRIQRELNILNTQASRVNALRKELIRTEMRIKIKNKFFQRLSAIGDQVFPRRKELIKDVSQEFLSDIDAFVEEYFVKNRSEDALFFLREEIKALQGLAKLLTLNTHSFTHTRMCLSNCWDKLKGLEKERKKERAQQKVYYKQNVDSVLEKIKAFTEKMATEEISIHDALSAFDEISSFMKSVELGRDEVKYLREEIAIAKKPIQEKIKIAEDERIAQEIERENQKKKFIEDLKLEVDQLFENCKTFDVEKICAERDALLKKITDSKLNKLEKNDFEKRIKTLKDVIQDKKEQAMILLSDDDKQALIQLTSVLNQRKERRLEIKNQLDLMRKTNGSSGFGFEQAMKNNELMNEEKVRLAKMDLGVKEIEQLIMDLKNKVKA